MRQERHAGYEVKALSNLIRRKVWELSGQPECDAFTEMQGMLLGFLCHNRDQEIFQKDLEEAFYIRRSTASRLLKRLEEESGGPEPADCLAHHTGRGGADQGNRR